MKRAAYFSPLPPMRTGIADYSAVLLSELSKSLEIDLFVDGYKPNVAELQGHFAIYDFHEYDGLRRSNGYDTTIYQMGNSPFHGYIYQTLLRRPGLTVLHDLVLHHFFIERTLEYRDTAGYLREMGYCGGQRGAAQSREAMLGYQSYAYYEAPLYRRVVDASRRIIVHSQYMARQVKYTHPWIDVATVPLLCDPRAKVANDALTTELRQRWGIAPGAFVVATFGRLDQQKRLDVLLRAFRKLLCETPHAIALLVGEPAPLFDARDLIQSQGLAGQVRLTGYVTQEEFYAAFDLADVAVNLRYPSGGETSAAVIQLLGRGVPLIVSDVGAFAELPDSACIKLPIGIAEDELLLLALRALADSTAIRDGMRHAGASYVAREHSLTRAAEGYLGEIERLCQGD
jgi:glycosyltransferase involved in cell wall biosynthesis